MSKDYYRLYKQILLIGIIIFVGSSCATTKVAPRKSLTKSDVWSILNQHNIEWDWWACKGKVRLNSTDMSGSGKIYLRVKHDSLIWSIAKKASIEVARMNATADEVFIKFPTEKTYQSGKIDQLSRQFGVALSYTDLQQLLVGNVFLPDTTSSTLVRQADGYLLSWSDPYGYEITYAVNDRTSQLQAVSITDRDGRRVRQSYADYKAASNSDIVVAYSRKIEVDADVRMSMRLTDVEIDEPKKTPFSISDRYTEISF